MLCWIVGTSAGQHQTQCDYCPSDRHGHAPESLQSGNKALFSGYFSTNLVNKSHVQAQTKDECIY